MRIKERAGLVVNIDLTGDALGFNKLIVTATKELMGYASGIVRENGMFFEETLDIFSSDNMPFSRFEIPAINIARVGGKTSFHCHTPGDKVDFVTTEGLQPTLTAGVSILSRVLNAEIYPLRREIDESLREKIEKYFWNLNLEEPELCWAPKYKK